VGPTFYGVKSAAKVTSITEVTTVYTPTNSISESQLENIAVTVFPNPTSDLIAVQIADMAKHDYNVTLFDISGKLVYKTTLYQGSTIAHFDARTLYDGDYIVNVSNGQANITKKVTVVK
jgi:hypothetical protein